MLFASTKQFVYISLSIDSWKITGFIFYKYYINLFSPNVTLLNSLKKSENRRYRSRTLVENQLSRQIIGMMQKSFFFHTQQWFLNVLTSYKKSHWKCSIKTGFRKTRAKSLKICNFTRNDHFYCQNVKV